ncbi:MAG: AAA family ATPase [Chloroflexota bacterium]
MYNAHFGFRQAPFGVTPDPQFYYSNAVYREAWATLRYGIEARKGFILVTGEAGTGKTTLLRKAMRAFGSNVKTAYISNTLVGYTELLRLMLGDLGLPNSTDSRSEMIERLGDYLIEQFAAGNTIALLIDEAQNLSRDTLEELRLLGNLETDKDKLLQIVLVGQPELEQQLDQPELRQLKQRLALRSRLTPIARDEVGVYIDSRLQTIGHCCENLFDAGAVEKVAAYSTGIPRLINIICDNALLAAFALSKPKISADIVDEVAEDLCLGDSQVKRDAQSQPLTNRFEEKEPSEFAPAPEEPFTLIEEPFFVDSGDRPTIVHEDSITPSRDARQWDKLIVSSSAAIVLLVGLSVLYSHETRFSLPGSYSAPAAAVEARSKDMNKIDLAASALKSKASSIMPRATLTAAQTQREILSVQNFSSGQPKNAIVASAAKGTVNHVATEAIVPKLPKTVGPPHSDKKETIANSATFLVVGPSFVRAKPTFSAAITATLEPGTRITIAGRTGDYYKIRSLGTEMIHGYVHKEDAFFERKS